MKNRLTTLILFLAIMAVPLAAHAQGKIGVININAAIASTAEGKKAIADLQKKYQPRQQELERLQQEIQGIQDQLSKQYARVERRGTASIVTGSGGQTEALKAFDRRCAE